MVAWFENVEGLCMRSMRKVRACRSVRSFVDETYDIWKQGGNILGIEQGQLPLSRIWSAHIELETGQK